MGSGLWINEMLINKLVHVAIQPTLGREHRFVQVATFVVALAGLHKHDGPLEELSVGAGEEHGDRPCAAGRAASPVQTRPAVVGPIEACAAAAGVVQTQRLGGLLRTRTLPPLLYRHSHRTTGTNVAESGFLQQLALRVLIGDPR